MFVKTANNTLVIKFKYNSYLVTKQTRYKNRYAELSYEHNETIGMVRLSSDSHRDYVSVKVSCNDNDIFVKHIGRELALIKLLKFVILDEEARKAVVAEYNKVYSKHPVDESKIDFILKNQTHEITEKVETN